MTQQPDHEIVDLEDDPTVPPRPEEEIADAVSAESADAGREATPTLATEARSGR
jgi:hypothetical protein